MRRRPPVSSGLPKASWGSSRSSRRTRPTSSSRSEAGSHESKNRPARGRIPRSAGRDAREGRLDSGGQGSRVRGDGAASASRDRRRPGGARHDRRPDRRAARARTTRHHDLRQSAAGRPGARSDACGREVPRLRSRGSVPDARRPLARLRVRGAESRSAQGGEAREARLRRARFLPRGAPLTTHRGLSRRRFSATPDSTTRASKVSSGRSRGRSPGGREARRSSRIRSVERSTSSRRRRRRPARTSGSPSIGRFRPMQRRCCTRRSDAGVRGRPRRS